MTKSNTNNVLFFSARGLIRTNNEDGVFVSQKKNLYAVADGLGGAAAGEVASQKAMTILAQWEPGMEANPLDGMHDIFDVINEQVFHLAENMPEYHGMGTTLTVTYLSEDTAYVGHVGDSRLYTFGENGLNLMSDDHTLEKVLKEQNKKLSKQQKNRTRNILTKAIGIGESVQPDIFKTPLAGLSCLFFCTDGVNKHVKDRELAEYFAAANGDYDRLYDDLIETIFQRGASDNFTFIILPINKEET